MPRLRTAAEIAASRRGTALGYNAIVSTDRRRPVTSRTSSEGFYLTPAKREAASATVRDDRRNMSILAWMVRRHLDNVSRFTPHFRMPGDTQEATALNDIVRRLMRWHARRRNFDALGRHGRDEFLRMFEAGKVLTGDSAALKVRGGKLQGIEGDRIAKANVSGVPDNVGKRFGDHGIAFGPDGARNAFMLCKRMSDGKSLEFEREVPASDMIFDGYWPERFDSDRGVSPLLSAINEAADVREAWEWHLLKVKAAGVFGFAFTRAGEVGFESAAPSGDTPETEPASYAKRTAQALKARGMINLDLDPGDDVKSIESSSPNPNVVPFTRELVRCVLLSLDIPFTFFDSLTASFSARIADRNEYEEACEWKREKNADVLDEIYGGWLFGLWAAADLFGFGAALKQARLSVEEAAAMLRWVPAGRPWLDRTNEMSGHILALTAGVTSTPRICSSYGDDAYEIAQEQAEYLARAGAPLLYAAGGQQAVQAIMAGMIGNKPSDDGKGSNDGKDDSQAQ